MKQSWISLGLWAAGILCNAALVLILLLKKCWKIVPFFTAWIAFDLVYSTIGVAAYQANYTWIYWVCALLDFLLQIAVLLEIGFGVLRRNGQWVEESKRELLPFLICGPILACVLALTMTPSTKSVLQALAARANLFSTILVCSLFTAVVRASQQLGLDWRSFIARISYGLMFWTAVAFFTNTLHAYWRTLWHFQALENIRAAAFQLALLYWCIAFWYPESGNKELPVELKK